MRGYDCTKKGCSRCGKHFPDYCRKYGILERNAIERIEANEVMSYEEHSTWQSE